MEPSFPAGRPIRLPCPPAPIATPMPIPPPIPIPTYLALVHAVIPALHKLYLQRPHVGAGRVQYGETLVVGVELGPRRQDVPVPAADPRYLVLLTKARAGALLTSGLIGNRVLHTRIINSTASRQHRQISSCN